MLKTSFIFCLNEIGNRSNLEDAIFPAQGKANESDRVFLVCDGVGGQSKGEEASRIVSTVLGHFLQKKKNITAPDVLGGLTEARREMAAYVAAHPDAARMSTTLTLCAINRDNVLVAWSGDSRVMHIRNGQLLFQTTDHSLVMELVKRCEITEDEAATHPQRNMILRSVNADAHFQDPDFHTLTNFKEGDWLLMCSDGVLENLTKTELAAIFDGSPDGPAVGNALTSLCMGRTKDNFSLYAIRIVVSPNSSPLSEPDRVALPKRNYLSLALLSAVIAVLLAVAGFFFFKSTKPQPRPAKPAEAALPAKVETAAAEPAQALSPPSYPTGEEGWKDFCRKNARYPEKALKNKLSGAVMLRFLVDTNGRAENIENVSSLGKGLEKELRRLVSKVVWVPGRANGQPVTDTMSVKWEFVLPDSLIAKKH